jgi:hypothetical protein
MPLSRVFAFLESPLFLRLRRLHFDVSFIFLIILDEWLRRAAAHQF